MERVRAAGDGASGRRRPGAPRAGLLLLLLLLLAAPLPAAPAGDADAAAREAWKRLALATETLAKAAGPGGGEKAAAAAAAVAGLQSAFAEGVSGRPLPEGRREEAAAAVARAAAAAVDPARLRALRTSCRNRALFLELLAGEGDPETREALLLGHLAREAAAAEQTPTPAGADLEAGPHSGAVVLDPGEARILSDAGLAGHRNGFAEAGETVVLQVPLTVSPRGPVRLAKGSLRSLDPLARVEEEEVTYATRDLSGKLQAGHPPGTVLRPRSGFTITFLPACPAGRRVPFELAFEEEGGATTVVPFTLRVHGIPPVLQGLLTVEDGPLPPGKGNDNGVLEPGERARVSCSFLDAGDVPVEGPSAGALPLSPLLAVEDPPGAPPSGAAAVPPGTSFTRAFLVSAVDVPERRPARLPLLLWFSGTVEGRACRWEFPVLLPLGVTEREWKDALALASSHLVDGDGPGALEVLSADALAYRLAGEGGAEARTLLEKARAMVAAPGGTVRPRPSDRGIFADAEGRRAARAAEAGTPAGAAVEAGLEWLAAHQAANGSWDADGFPANCGSLPCDGAGAPLYDTGVTGLAVLAFLGNGETHRTPRWGKVVRAGLGYLLSVQDGEGCVGDRRSTHFVYGHAIGALALCEAYGATGSKALREPAERAVRFTLACQNPGSGWRYGVRPGDNDTSVTGWMASSLRAAADAGLAVDQAGLAGARKWLDAVTDPGSGRTGYTERGNGPGRPSHLLEVFWADRSESLTAIGILTRIHSGQRRDAAVVARGVGLCLDVLPVWNEKDGSIDYYYWYYGSAALFQVGGEPWRKWNAALRKVLLGNQRMAAGDHRRGSWDPKDPWGEEGGRIYSTALNVLSLETAHRHARILE